jgi:hypothetical protein
MACIFFFLAKGGCALSAFFLLRFLEFFLLRTLKGLLLEIRIFDKKGPLPAS